LLLSGVAQMTQQEQAALQRYLDAGGKVIALGPTALADCKSNWVLPTRLDLPEKEFFSWVDPGSSVMRTAKWLRLPVASSSDPDVWSQPREGLFYHPQRICEKANNQKLLELCRSYMKPMPVKVLQAAGYLCTMFETQDSYVVHFLAEDYDVDIDHELDRIRFHRSRVNIITKAEPIGIDGKLRLEANTAPKVYTPFCPDGTVVAHDGKVATVTLPDKCTYAILVFSKKGTAYGA
jgi:hypothetical protein